MAMLEMASLLVLAVMATRVHSFFLRISLHFKDPSPEALPALSH